MKAHQIIIIGGVTFTALTASITAIYLPFFSKLNEKKENINQNKVQNNGGGGSMWTNMDRKIKENKKSRESH
jgi:dipeptidase